MEIIPGGGGRDVIQGNGLATYESDKPQKEHKSRMETMQAFVSVISLSIRVVHVILPYFTLERCSGTICHQKL